MYLFLYFSLLMLAGCATVSDGRFSQVGGRSIDYEVVDSFEEGRSDINEIVSRLGEPASREKVGRGLELTYISTRRRESIDRAFGMVQDRSVQTIEERVVFVFVDNKLVSKEKSYRVF